MGAYIITHFEPGYTESNNPLNCTGCEDEVVIFLNKGVATNPSSSGVVGNGTITATILSSNKSKGPSADGQETVDGMTYQLQVSDDVSIESGRILTKCDICKVRCYTCDIRALVSGSGGDSHWPVDEDGVRYPADINGNPVIPKSGGSTTEDYHVITGDGANGIPLGQCQVAKLSDNTLIGSPFPCAAGLTIESVDDGNPDTACFRAMEGETVIQEWCVNLTDCCLQGGDSSAEITNPADITTFENTTGSPVIVWSGGTAENPDYAWIVFPDGTYHEIESPAGENLSIEVLDLEDEGDLPSESVTGSYSIISKGTDCERNYIWDGGEWVGPVHKHAGKVITTIPFVLLVSRSGSGSTSVENTVTITETPPCDSAKPIIGVLVDNAQIVLKEDDGSAYAMLVNDQLASGGSGTSGSDLSYLELNSLDFTYKYYSSGSTSPSGQVRLIGWRITG